MPPAADNRTSRSPPARSEAAFGEQVRDGLLHLHDLAHLQRHPLARLLGPPSSPAAARTGRRLQQMLLQAIDELRPGKDVPPASHAWRTYTILKLRFAEALDVPEVIVKLAISRGEYFRDQRRALDAVGALLAEKVAGSATVPAGEWRGADANSVDDRARVDAAGRSERPPAPTNLPPPLTRFIGREPEIVAVRRAIESTRLLTLIGTGGCGKTRLALAVAAELAEGYLDGVWLVELGPLADPSLVPSVVAAAVGVREEPGHPLRATLLAALHSRRLLLVLDNCEHLLGACSDLADALLRACPDVRILATSREALGIAAEVRWRVPSLTMPSPESLPTIERLTRYEAIQLFVERALAVKSNFALNPQNARAVAQVCWRLDGIPLAIELAAARVRVLTVEQIAARLDDRFHLLTGGSRTAPTRQQTMQATVDWSYHLLSDAERALLRRLAIFAGSWALEAAEAVGEGLESVLDLLTALVDKSWVIAEEQDGEERYRLLETFRQYAGEKLRECGEAETARARHRDWYRALVGRAEPELNGPRQREWLDRLERERDNLRAVLQESAADPSCLEDGLWMAASLLRLWIVRGYLGEGRHVLGALLASAASAPGVQRTTARMDALFAASLVAYIQGDYTATGSLAEESLAVARELGDERGIWFATDQLAGMLMNQGDYARAAALFDDFLGAMQRLGHRYGIYGALLEHGILKRLQGDYERAAAFCAESLRLSREAGDLWFTGQTLGNLGLAYYQQGEYERAREQFAEALALRRELRDQSGIAWSLINLGDVEQALGDNAAARGRFEESLAILRELGDRSGAADALSSLGRVARSRGDYAAARACYAESLTIRRELGHRLAMPATFEDLAGLAAALAQHARALTLAGAAGALRDALGAPPSPVEREHVERWLGPVRAALGDKDAIQAWAAGQALTLEQAIAYALEGDGS